MTIFRLILSTLCALAILISSCSPQSNTTYTTIQSTPTPTPPKLSIINIIDQNGLTETISSPDRIKQFEGVNFLSCQPYKKVMRIFSRDACGNTSALITSYHPNGQPWQYLEIVNGRAMGVYKEWFSNGRLKILSTVIGGDPDLTLSAQKTWLFEGLSEVWDEQGKKVADLPYAKGYLEGEAVYFHASGSIWKTIQYCQNSRQGPQKNFLEGGELLSEINFQNDLPHGAALRWWNSDRLASEEFFNQGKLISGSYWDSKGRLITEVKNGWGKRTQFGRTTVSKIQEFKDGVAEGRVENYSNQGDLVSTYYIKDEAKHGEEIQFYPGRLDPKLAITWYKGKIQGPSRSWYKNGQLESQRELSDNAKNGLLSAWYEDGNLMMLEDYEKDKLVRGEYFRRGEKNPASEVNKGRGVATIFDAEGHFLRKLTYNNGIPE